MIRRLNVLAVRGDRGAVLPEYALIVALIVLASLGVILALADTGEDRLQDSDDRIGLPADAANYGVGATTTTLQSSTTTTTVVGQTLRVGSITKSPNPSQGSPDSKWIANATITAIDSSDTPVSGVIVTGSWSSSGPGAAATCTTDVTGSCSVQRIDLNDNAPTERFTVSGMTKAGFTFIVGATDLLDVACNPPLNADCD